MFDLSGQTGYLARIMKFAGLVATLAVLGIAQIAGGQSEEELHPVPLSASAYETKEPTINHRLETVRVNDRFERRIYRSHLESESWYELITGTGEDTNKVYAYFHFLPLSQVRFDGSKKDARWGKIVIKYLLLADAQAQQRARGGGTEDLKNLLGEAMVKERMFYSGIETPATNEGIDLRGIHLMVRPWGDGKAVIIGCSTKQWHAIRSAVMHGQGHPLYELFPK